MKQLVANTRTRVWGTRNSWSLAPHKGAGGRGTECNCTVVIEGDDRNGYNLVMSPVGFFASDQWYKTLQEALADADELFGIHPNAWTEKDT